MKKMYEVVKPFSSVIFGALLFLLYLNGLQLTGAALAMPIIGVILAAYYITVGVLGIALGEKFSQSARRIVDVVSMSLFPLFLFVQFLLSTIQANAVFGPTAWFIYIVSMVASLAFATLFLVAEFAKSSFVNKAASLFALLFILSMILDLLFDIDGSTYALGELSLFMLVIYATYTVMLFASLAGLRAAPVAKQEPAQVEEEPAEEPAPEAEEEKPAEEPAEESASEVEAQPEEQPKEE